MNSIVYDSENKEQKFIRLIQEKEVLNINQQFKSLFDETPLLGQFCFINENGIRKKQIQTTILEI